MKRALQVLGQVYRTVAVAITMAVYFGFGPFGYAVFGLLLLMPASDPFKRARRLQAVQSFAFRFMHRWMHYTGILRFHWENLDLDELPQGPFIVVANHHTISDASSILGFFRGMATIVRPGVYNAWWIQGLVKGSLHIKGTNSYAGAARVVEDGVHRLEGGLRVVFFPEGTRSQPGELNTFSRVPFEIACKADVPVVPVRVIANPGWLTKGKPFLPTSPRQPKLRLIVMPTVLPADYGNDSKKLHAAIVEMYEQHFAERPGVDTPPAPAAIEAA